MALIVKKQKPQILQWNHLPLQLSFFSNNFLCKQDAIKKNKIPSTSKVKQKQEWYGRVKNVYLKRNNFFCMG